MEPHGPRSKIGHLWLAGIAPFLLLLGLHESCPAEQTIMPPIPRGIHLTYRVTSQLPALPPEWIEQRTADDMKVQDAVLEQRLRFHRSRALAGPQEADTAEYWGTMHSFMYAQAKGGCVAYDGKKTAHGSALYMVPDLIRHPTTEHSGMSIAFGTSPIEARVPYLGIYQPGTELFDPGVVLSKTVPLATGEKRVYRLPSRRNVALEYDKEGRVRRLTISANEGTIVLDEYRFADYAMVDGIHYPREVSRKKLTVFRGKDGKIVQAPDWFVSWRVTSASAGPIPNSFFALSTARPGAQVEDNRYQVPGKGQPGITYTYTDPTLNIDQASERAYRTVLSRTQPNRRRLVTAIQLGCLALIALVGGGLLVIFLRGRKPPERRGPIVVSRR